MKFQEKYLFKKSNTFFGNEKWLWTETLQTHISFNASYAAFSHFWLTLHYIESKKTNSKIRVCCACTHTHVKRHTNIHTTHTHTCTIWPRPMWKNKKSCWCLQMGISGGNNCSYSRHQRCQEFALSISLCLTFRGAYERIFHPAARPELK